MKWQVADPALAEMHEIQEDSKMREVSRLDVKICSHLHFVEVPRNLFDSEEETAASIAARKRDQE